MRKLFSSVVLCGLVLASVAAGAVDLSPYIVDHVVDPDGRVINVILVPGVLPPAVKMPAVRVPERNLSRGVNSVSNVPAFDWSYGCTATSAAMMAGHYDNTGYPNMYAGPTNGGLCPMDNSTWGYGECPLSATHQGYDGLATRGHVDDYWVSYGSSADDPYITNGWVQHTYADCTADFMKTNQSAYGNTDGATTLYYDPSGAPYSSTNSGDGAYGLKLFFVSRGYTVTSYYTQLIEGEGTGPDGFTYADFQAEIDAGRPVLIHVEGHTMLGFGYNTTGNIIYLHDTWDHLDHQMTWAGSYDGMAQWGVSVFVLAANESIFFDGFETSNCSQWSDEVQ